MPNDALTRLAATFRNVARRAERVIGTGNAGAQRQVASPVEVLGIEDDTRLLQVPDGQTPKTVYVGFEGGVTNSTMSADSSINAFFGQGSGRHVSMWIYILPSEDSSDREMYLVDTTAGTSSGWIISLDFVASELFGTLSFFINFSTTDGKWTTTDKVIPVGTWTHVLVRYNGTDADQNPTLWVNAVAVDITETSTPAGSLGGADANTKTIGQRSGAGGGGKKLQGYLDHMLWKKGSVGQSTVEGLMNQVPHTSDSDLIVYIPFDEGESTTAADNSSNSNDITLGNDVQWYSETNPGTGFARAGEFVL